MPILRVWFQYSEQRREANVNVGIQELLIAVPQVETVLYTPTVRFLEDNVLPRLTSSYSPSGEAFVVKAETSEMYFFNFLGCAFPAWQLEQCETALVQLLPRMDCINLNSNHSHVVR